MVDAESGGGLFPIVIPAVIGAQAAQVEHGLGVIGFPPRAREFESFLSDVTMSALTSRSMDLPDPTASTFATFAFCGSTSLFVQLPDRPSTTFDCTR